MTDKRLIEVAFPLKQASLDSVHEKNVRHGHISTLHIWPARRPLAACRAALIATLLPDPGDPDERQRILEKLAGKVVQRMKKKKDAEGRTVEEMVEETEGGILHWGRESGPDLDWFRQKIREAYGGRAPKVLDPFAGGGAIPLEAMRLGCEATAVDINPVAWFILKCTLEYPQKLAGKKLPLPDFVKQDRKFMEAFLKAQGYKGSALPTQLDKMGFQQTNAPELPGMESSGIDLSADLAWHVRAWGNWVLKQARRELAPFYPTYADFEPLAEVTGTWKKRPMQLVPLNEDGETDIAALNTEFDEAYLKDKHNPRWVAKPTVAYLWARTVTCKNCRATIPLLKTRWLCKKDKKRVVLNLTPTDLTPNPSPQSGEGSQVAKVPGYVYELCRKLRAEQTPAEQILWEALRDRHLGGFKFRRQHPLGRYIADFYCAEARLVIEMEGEVHELSEQKHYDRLRDEELQARKLRVLHFKNEEAASNLESLLDAILRNLTLPFTPPSPQAERGAGGVRFSVQTNAPVQGSTPDQRRENDKKTGSGTMSRSGATCPCCGAIMTMQDIRLEGQAGCLGALMTAVVVDGPHGKEYRLPTPNENEMAAAAEKELEAVFAEIPFGLPDEPTPAGGGSGAGRAFSVQNYGLMRWQDLFIDRQLLSLGIFVKDSRLVYKDIRERYPQEWNNAITSYLACIFSRMVDYMANLCVWEKGAEEVKHVFMRWALPITWDFAEANPLSSVERFYIGGLNSAFQIISRLHQSPWVETTHTKVLRQSALTEIKDTCDLIFTDPPYYDAIPYSDCMDFFYVWLRRILYDSSNGYEKHFSENLTPKWDCDKEDGELIDDDSRCGGNTEISKQTYEDGMFRAFLIANQSLSIDGRMVVVFANKNPSAWETLVASIIRAGFCVTGSWPIASEMPGGLRNLNRASLSSSVWLVCKKRQEIVRPGWDNKVLEEMRQNITTRLRNFWDAGIRGPDFVWAATGPALEAYSQYPAVKKANEPNQLMSVSDFLSQVRRMVVDFVVGRVLSEAGEEAVSGLDAVTTYYLLHRHDFKLGDAPAGPCILYAISCGLSDKDLADRFDILSRKGKSEEKIDEAEMGEAEEAGEENELGGNVFRLKAWNQRKRPNMGYDPHLDRHTSPPGPLSASREGGRAGEVPLIDQVHRLMQLWRCGDVTKVDEYLDLRGLRRSQLFHPLLQALIELAAEGSEERSLLESISNHVGAAAPHLPYQSKLPGN